MKKSEGRQSNIELLRILAMVLIIIHHICYHVLIKQTSGTGYNMYAPFQMFNNFVYYKRLTLIEFGGAFGKIGNDIFVLIAGYFLIDKDINLLKQSKKIVTQAIYIGVVLLLLSFVYSKINYDYQGLFTFAQTNNSWWFAGYYLLIIAAAALFINKFVSKLDNKQYLTLLIVLFSLIELSFAREVLNKLISESLATGIFVYLLGGYIKKYNPFKDIKSIVFVLLAIISFGIMIISYRNQVLFDIRNAMANGQETFYQRFVNYVDYSPLVLTIAVSLFELFSRLKIKDSKIINYIAGSTFMMYLFHDNEVIHCFTRGFDWIGPFHDNLPLFFLMILIKVAAVFIIGVILYSIYNLLIKCINSNTVKKLIYKK